MSKQKMALDRRINNSSMQSGPMSDQLSKVQDGATAASQLSEGRKGSIPSKQNQQYAPPRTAGTLSKRGQRKIDA
jgi:hypothetical protein